MFYQQNWDFIGDSIISLIQHLWNNPQHIQDYNDTLLVMVSKIPKPEFVIQFRPITLCKVIYKCFTKMLVSRLKPTLWHRISPFQASFVSGQNIHDNIIIAQEMVHSMQKIRGKRGFMAIKINLEKAYDRLSWQFVKSCLHEFGILVTTINLIMRITTSSFNLIWNGLTIDSFAPH